MFARLKPVLPYVYVPLILIVCANLLGLLSPVLVSLLARASAFARLPGVEYWHIALSLIVLAVAYSLLWRYAMLHQPRRGIPRLPDLGYAHFLARPLIERAIVPPLIKRRVVVIQRISSVILICIAFVSLVYLCVLAYEIASAVLVSRIFKRYILVFFLVVTFATLLFLLRLQGLRSLTWKKLADLWLKIPTIGAITVSGFGFIATSDPIKIPVLKLTLKSEFTNLTIIVPTMICAVSFLGFAGFIAVIGRTISQDVNGNTPQGLFYTAFGFAFLGKVAVFSLFLNSVLVTVLTHYAMQTQSIT